MPSAWREKTQTRAKTVVRRRTHEPVAPAPEATHAATLRDVQRIAGNRGLAVLVAQRRDAGQPAAATAESLAAVQRFEVPSDEALKDTGEKVEAFSTQAPAADAILWELIGPQLQRLVLLGTVHVNIHKIPYFNKAGPLLDYLERTKFDSVFVELRKEDVDQAPQIAGVLREIVSFGKPVPLYPPDANTRAKLPYIKYRQNIEEAEKRLGPEPNAPLVDDFFGALAAKGGPVLDLESEASRADIRSLYAKGGGSNAEDLAGAMDEAELVFSGNQKELAARRAKELKAGKDRKDVEARNRYWLTESQNVSDYAEKTVLWVVGASHIGGISANLQQEGWTAAPITL